MKLKVFIEKKQKPDQGDFRYVKLTQKKKKKTHITLLPASIQNLFLIKTVGCLLNITIKLIPLYRVQLDTFIV